MNKDDANFTGTNVWAILPFWITRALEKTGKSIEKQLEQKDEQIKQLTAEMNVEKTNTAELQNQIAELRWIDKLVEYRLPNIK